MKELEIRYTNLKDLDYLLNWLKDPDTNKWLPMSTQQEIESIAKNWIGFSRYNASLTGVYNNQVCAIGTLLLMPYKKLSHHAMFYLVVAKEFRNKGIGDTMLKNLINLAQKHFKLESIFVEVYEGCSLISLLEKNKFEKCAYQEKFVKENNQYLARILFDIWFQ